MLDLLYNRRSIRKYSSVEIEEAKIEALKKSMLLSPSGMNKKAWRAIMIKDKKLIEKTAEVKAHGTLPLKSAPLAIVIIGLTEKSDVWIEDCSIISIIAQLEAETLGLGSCWIQIRNRRREDGTSSGEWLKELLNLEDGESVESIITVGYAGENPEAYNDTDLDFSKISEL